MKNVITYITILLILVGLSYYLGTKKYFQETNVTQITEVTHVYDTVTHVINDTNYISVLDTVTIVDTNFVNVLDSNELVKAYYSKYFYNRSWKDSLIEVNLYDGITQNKPFKSDFSYKILRPQTVINNTYITNTKYLSVGLRTNLTHLEYSSIELYYIQDRVNLGVSYAPFSKSVSLTVSKNIFKWK